jgi:integrase
MSRTKFGSLPSYRLHKPSGRAVVTIAGKDHYLGPHGSAESRAEYDRLMAEHLANAKATVTSGQPFLTVDELILAYHQHAAGYYRDAPKEREKIRLALRPLRRLYGATAAADFRPLALQAVRQELLKPQTQSYRRTVLVDGKRAVREWTREYKLGRRTVNMRIDVIRRMFKWAVGQELVPASIYEGLRAVAGLRRGRSAARDERVVRPVADEHVEQTLPHLSGHVRAMVEFQRLTGARSEEVCSLRASNLDTSGPVWVYRPAKHKTENRGHDRLVYIGPKAQAVLRLFLEAAAEEYVFSPRRCLTERHAAQRAARKTPAPPSQRDRRKARPQKRAGVRYTPNAYGHAVKAACKKAGTPHWHPHQLRHTAATQLRKEFGVEVARVALGHRHLSATEIYAEPNQKRTLEAIACIG